jgi:hypothetical protein
MPDKGPLLQLLKSELAFLSQTGSGRTQGKAAPIFQESTCLRFRNARNDCIKCPLIEFVPVIFRTEKVPCQHIPLNAGRETLHTLRQQCTEGEVTEAVRQWLSVMIQSMSQERKNARRTASRTRHSPGIH